MRSFRFLVILTFLQAVAPFAAGQARSPELARLIERVGRSDKTPGAAVAYTVGGRTSGTAVYGFSNVETRSVVTPSTRFGIGSISKTLTMVLALRLADKGVIDLDAPIERYLTDFPYPGRGITVRNIGTHLSGYADEFDNRYFYNTARFENTDKVLAEFYRERPAHPAGAKTVYGTTTFTLIAGVVERVTRMTFADAMREYVTKPLKLDSIVPNDRRAIVPDRTSFYVSDGARGVVNGEFVDSGYKLAGAGLLSNAEDLAKFGAALIEGDFLSPEARRQLFSPAVTATGEQTPFALGIRVVRDGPSERVFQPGGGVGIASVLCLDRKERKAAAIVTNFTGSSLAAWNTCREIFLMAE